MPDLSPSPETMPDIPATVAAGAPVPTHDFGAVLTGFIADPPEQPGSETDVPSVGLREDEDGLEDEDCAPPAEASPILTQIATPLAIPQQDFPKPNDKIAQSECDITSISDIVLGESKGVAVFVETSATPSEVEQPDETPKPHDDRQSPDSEPQPEAADRRADPGSAAPPMSRTVPADRSEQRSEPVVRAVRDIAVHRLATEPRHTAPDPAIGVEIVARDAGIDRVHIDAPAAVTRELVASELPRLVTALSANGVGIGSVSVGVNGQGPREGWQGQEPPGARLIWSRAATPRRTAIRGFTAYA